MDGIINVRINGNHLTKDSRRAGVQHEGNATSLRIEFDEGWVGYAKTVTFWNARGENPVKQVLTTDKLPDIIGSLNVYLCPIPPEAMTEAGELTFVVDGYADGIRQRSVSDVLEVIYAPFDPEAGEPTDPTPTQAEQLQGQIDSIIGTVQNAAISAQNAAISAGEAAMSAVAAGVSEANASNSAVQARASESMAATLAGSAQLSAADADAHQLAASIFKDAAEVSKTHAETAALRAETARDKAAVSEANAGYAMVTTEIIAQRAADALAQVTDITDKHTEVMAKAYQVERDADRAEAAAKEAEQIAGGDFATPAEVEYAVTKHNADSNAHPIIDNTTFRKYKLGMEGGMVYMEEVL